MNLNLINVEWKYNNFINEEHNIKNFKFGEIKNIEKYDNYRFFKSFPDYVLLGGNNDKVLVVALKKDLKKTDFHVYILKAENYFFGPVNFLTFLKQLKINNFN